MYLNKILVTTDLSSESTLAFDVAAQEARRSNSEITLVHIAETPNTMTGYPASIMGADFMAMNSAEIREAAQKALSVLAAEHFPGSNVTCAVLDRPGFAPAIIAEYAAENHFGLIVTAAHGKGFVHRMLLGTTTEALVRLAPCPVLVIPKIDRGEARLWPYRRILVTTDFSESSEASFRYAAFEAKRNSAVLVIGHVLEELVAPALIETMREVKGASADIQQQYVAEAGENLKKYAGQHSPLKDVQTELIPKTRSIANSIAEFAKSSNCDLIVISARKVNAAIHPAGTVGRLLRQTPCPVLVVPE